MTRHPAEAPAPDGARVLRIPAHASNLARVRRFVEAEALASGVDPDVTADVVQAVDESVTNILAHGYRGDPGVVEVEVEVAGGAMVVRLRDQAPPFDPTRVVPPDLGGPLTRRPLGGMGVQLTRELTDAVEYRRPSGWSNELTLIRRIASTVDRGR